jgi:transcriptional regulator GlxA family with amidase domain
MNLRKTMYYSPGDLDRQARLRPVRAGRSLAKPTAFANRMGISPAKYLQKIRMDKAKRLQEETNSSITESAYTLGYANQCSFSRAFKMHSSILPQAVRASR